MAIISRYRQIGMAVPTRGARAIFTAILKTFARVDYDFVEPSIARIYPKGVTPDLSLSSR